MGVQARVVLYARDDAAAEEAAAAAFARLDELEQVMSDYRPASELMALCREADGTPRPVSLDLYTVVRKARQVAESTGGAFDPTVGHLSAWWREARRSGSLPPPEALQAALARSGWRRIDVSHVGAVALQPETALDLGGIGKGFAASEAVGVLRRAGAGRCLVALAGDIALGDAPPGAAGWRIEIGGTGGGAGVTLSRTCISTSGDIEQHVEIDGVRYSHIVDPATGLGLTRRVQATVVHPDGATADALSTALCVAGVGRAPSVLAGFPAAAALVVEAGDGGGQHRSERFPALSGS